MQWFLIVIIAVAFLLLTVVGVYFIVKFQHPDDKNEAWAPKLVVLFGFIMAGATVLLLPLDVANDGTFPGTSLRKSVILVVLMCFFSVGYEISYFLYCQYVTSYSKICHFMLSFVAFE